MEATLHTQRIRRALHVALALNAAVAIAKIVYGRAAHSLAIEADGYHSLTDGLSSVVALIGLGLARRPPDADHPYGHRKIELLAASAIGISLLLLAVRIGGDVMTHVRDQSAHRPSVGWQAFVVLLATFAVNVGVSVHQAREGRRLGSMLLMSDAKHTRADCYVTGGIVLTTLLAWAGRPELDVIAAAVVAGLIAVTGAEILLTNARYLTDTALVEPNRIRQIARGIACVTEAHTIRTRGTPDAIFVDLRIRLPGGLSVREADAVTRDLAAAIRREVAFVVDVTIHTEPEPSEAHDRASEASVCRA